MSSSSEATERAAAPSEERARSAGRERGSQARSASARRGAAATPPTQAYDGPTFGTRTQGAVLRSADIGRLDALPTPPLRESMGGPESMLLATELADSLLGQVAEEARASARAQGYSVGWAEGRRAAAAEADRAARELAALNAEAEAQRAAEHDAALSALAKTTSEVRSLLADLAARVESQAAELAWELTATLVDREVTVADEADVIRRVLRVLPEGKLATVRVHPSVVSIDAAGELRQAGVVVIGDPNLGRADALVECDGTVADLRISEALERVRQVLA